MYVIPLVCLHIGEKLDQKMLFYLQQGFWGPEFSAESISVFITNPCRNSVSDNFLLYPYYAEFQHAINPAVHCNPYSRIYMELWVTWGSSLLTLSNLQPFFEKEDQNI